METIRIKCPNCGAILTVEDSPANLGKKVKCPICKLIYSLESFKKMPPKISEEEDRTCLGGSFSADDVTVLPEIDKTLHVGYLWDERQDIKYPLSEGINLIGRMSLKSDPVATLPIQTDDKGFSRKHLYIDVVKGSDGVLRYYAYNAENKNKTTVNSVQITGQDTIILRDGDLIESSSTRLLFKIQ